MREGGYEQIMTTFTRYTLIQIPGWLICAIVLSATHISLAMPVWAAAGLVAVWVGKDFALYPFLKHAYEAGAKTGAQRLIGSVGEVQQTPGPLGYIRVNGELWRTKVISDGRLLPPGARVLVQAVHGLTLHVIPLDQPAQRVNDHC